jgi:hypothetical protein
MLFIDDILLSPFAGFSFIMRTILKMAEEEWTDDAPLKEQLLMLQVQLEGGEISEEQYVEAEAAILKALRDVQRRKIEMAGGDPDAMEGGLSGKVQEGSGVSLNLTYGEESRK